MFHTEQTEGIYKNQWDQTEYANVFTFSRSFFFPEISSLKASFDN